jgi:hypothetical protein
MAALVFRLRASRDDAIMAQLITAGEPVKSADDQIIASHSWRRHTDQATPPR